MKSDSTPAMFRRCFPVAAFLVSHRCRCWFPVDVDVDAVVDGDDGRCFPVARSVTLSTLSIVADRNRSALTAGHLTMFKLGSGKRLFQDGAMRIFGAPLTSSKGIAFSN